MSEKENKNPDYNNLYDKNPDIKNQQSLDDIMKDPELVEKILAEKGIKLPEKDTEEKARINIEAISVIMNGLVFFVLGIFITSPFIQLFCRVIDDLTDSKWNVGVSGIVDNRKFINNYQHMIGNINAGKGVHQGCILSPCLFNLHTEYIMRNAGWMKHKLELRNINNLS